jgi:HD-like signal output (HDOD) protein
MSLLVSLPSITLRLMSLITDPNSSVKDLREVVEKDPALAAKVISLANSSYYSVRSPIKTVDRAITIIGYQELGFMAMGLGLNETFNINAAPEDFDGEGLWLHSLAVSWLAQRLAMKIGFPDSGEAMIAGLLHELGIIILVSKFPLLFQKLMDLILAGHNWLAAENALKIRHDLVGYELAKLWKLPEVYQEAILYHHVPERARQNKVLVAMTSLSDALSSKIGFGLKTEINEVDLGYSLSALSLTPYALQDFIRETIGKINEALPMWRQLLKSAQRPTNNSRFSSLIKDPAKSADHDGVS